MTQNPPTPPSAPGGSPWADLTDEQRADRRAQAVDMHAAGMSTRQIATAIGCAQATAWRIIQADLKAAVRERNLDRQVLLGRELHVLDRLTQANMPRALRGDYSAAMIVLRAHDRRARLYGLNAPVRHTVEVSTHVDQEIERLVTQLESSGAGPLPIEP